AGHEGTPVDCTAGGARQDFDVLHPVHDTDDEFSEVHGPFLSRESARNKRALSWCGGGGTWGFPPSSCGLAAPELAASALSIRQEPCQDVLHPYRNSKIILSRCFF